MENHNTLPGQEQWIAVAVAAGPGHWNLNGEFIFRAALQNEFRRNGCEWLQWAGFCRPGFVLQLIELRELKPVLGQVKGMLDKLSILGLSFIGYLDHAEGYWRCVWPMGSINFAELFLKAEDLAAALAESKAYAEAFAKMVCEITGKNQKP